MLFIFGYLCFCGWQHNRAFATQSQLAAERSTAIERGRVMPMLFSPLLWRSIYTSNGKIFADGIRVVPFKAVSVREGGQIVQATQLPEGEKPESLRAFRILSWFADGYVSSSRDGERLVAGDQRFAIITESTTPLWGLEFDRSGFQAWGGGLTGRLGEREMFWSELFHGEGYHPLQYRP